jgi:drug/metabolite transporter (DMT)-like permease
VCSSDLGWTQKVLGASRVAVTLYLGPLYTALAAWFLLSEPLGGFHLIGGLLILGGVGLVMAVPVRQAGSGRAD